MTGSGKILGIDYGESTIGLAISSEDRTFVFGRGTLPNESSAKLFERLTRMIDAEHIVEIVVGYPVRTDGTRGDSTHAVDKFVEHLRANVPIPVMLEDERFSTQLAHQLADPAKRRKEDDEGAARVILQSYLDRMHHV